MKNNIKVFYRIDFMRKTFANRMRNPAIGNLSNKINAGKSWINEPPAKQSINKHGNA